MKNFGAFLAFFFGVDVLFGGLPALFYCFFFINFSVNEQKKKVGVANISSSTNSGNPGRRLFVLAKRDASRLHPLFSLRFFFFWFLCVFHINYVFFFGRLLISSPFFFFLGFAA